MKSLGERTIAPLARRLRARVGGAPVPAFEHVPAPPSERGHWLLAGAIGALGAAVLVAVLTGLVGGPGAAPAQAPPVVIGIPAPLPTPTPAPASTPAGSGAIGAGGAGGAGGARGAGGAGGVGGAGKTGAKGVAGAIVGSSPAGAEGSSARLESPLEALTVPVPARWIAGFYPIYTVAQRTFAVNWLLLASIHEQETAFSTARGTYHGLNFAGCCGGPMQFNVTNGPVTTWDLVKDSYRYGIRPAAYDHPTARHPSIYDDFDAVMAAAHLLSADGATFALDVGAWGAAYDYYGHDSAGVAYADEVLARAIGWSQHGFCPGCAVEPGMLAAVHAAYGAPVEAALEAQAATPRPLARAARRRPGR